MFSTEGVELFRFLKLFENILIELIIALEFSKNALDILYMLCHNSQVSVLLKWVDKIDKVLQFVKFSILIKFFNET